MPRAGAGICQLGSTRDSWRVLEFWEDQRGRAEASVSRFTRGPFLPRSPASPSPPRPPGTGLMRKSGRNSSSALSALYHCQLLKAKPEQPLPAELSS